MKADEVVENISAAEAALKQKEQAVKKQSANLRIQKALTQYRKIANKPAVTKPAPKL